MLPLLVTALLWACGGDGEPLALTTTEATDRSHGSADATAATTTTDDPSGTTHVTSRAAPISTRSAISHTGDDTTPAHDEASTSTTPPTPTSGAAESSEPDSGTGPSDAPGSDGEDSDDPYPPPPLPPWADHDIRFEELSVAGIDDIRFHPNLGDGNRMGTGIAFADLDGDGRLDLFVGEDGQGEQQACIYRNVSDEQGPRFEADPTLCGALGSMTTGIALPRYDSPREDLLLVGRNVASHLTLLESGDPVLTPIYALPDWEEEPAQACFASSVLPIDAALDGTRWFAVGCRAAQHSIIFERLTFSNNRYLREDADGTFDLVDAPHPAFANPASTLALALIDADDDGLHDLVIVNDTYSSPNVRQTHYDPGGLLRRCSPLESCTWDMQRFLDDNSAWGSFMGAAFPHVAGSPMLYLTDWGPNRLLRRHPDGTRFVDEAAAHNAELAETDDQMLFAWSAVVDDFNGNGRDDLFVTHGSPRGANLVDAIHRDHVLRHEEDGTFSRLGDDVGLPGPDAEGSTVPGFLTSSRGALRVDLTGDGRLELVVVDLRGPLRVFTEVVPDERPPRCSVDPRPRLGLHTGTGYSFARHPSAQWRTWDIQGHLLIGAPSRLLLPWQSGYLRFPSGAVVPWDCEGTPGPIAVYEPEWVHVATEADELEMRVDAPWLFERREDLDVEVVFLADDPDDPFALPAVASRLESYTEADLRAGVRVDGAASATSVMLRLGDRWIPHRFGIRD